MLVEDAFVDANSQVRSAAARVVVNFKRGLLLPRTPSQPHHPQITSSRNTSDAGAALAEALSPGEAVALAARESGEPLRKVPYPGEHPPVAATPAMAAQ